MKSNEPFSATKNSYQKTTARHLLDRLAFHPDERDWRNFLWARPAANTASHSLVAASHCRCCSLLFTLHTLSLITIMEVEEGKVNLVSVEKERRKRAARTLFYRVNIFRIAAAVAWKSMHDTRIINSLFFNSNTGEQGGRFLWSCCRGCQHVGVGQVHDGWYVL